MADIHDLVRPPRRHWSAAGERALRGGNKRRRRSSVRWGELRLMVLAGVLVGLTYTAPWSPPTGGGTAEGEGPFDVRFALCDEGAGAPCVIDGDTFRFGGDKIRIADIDTPETHPPQCAHEAELGARATTRLRELLNGGPFKLAAIDRERSAGTLVLTG